MPTVKHKARHATAARESGVGDLAGPQNNTSPPAQEAVVQEFLHHASGRPCHHLPDRLQPVRTCPAVESTKTTLCSPGSCRTSYASIGTTRGANSSAFASRPMRSATSCGAAVGAGVDPRAAALMMVKGEDSITQCGGDRQG